MLPSSFNGYFTLIREQYGQGTRAAQSAKLFLPRTDTVRYGTHSIRIKAIKSWNEFIDNHRTKSIVSLSRRKFKNLVFQSIIETY